MTLNEKREFSRVPFETKAVVTTDSKSLEGEVENLSLNGMLFKSEKTFDEGEMVSVLIQLRGGEDEISINMGGTVVRNNEDGAAIKFNLKQIEIDSLTSLRYVVGYNLGDDATVMKEYFEHLKKSNTQF